MNSIEEIKNFINEKEYYGDFESFFDDYYDDFDNEEIDFILCETLKSDDHRWYQVDYNVYEFIKNRNSLGYLCIEEVGMLKSESMTRADCYYNIKAYNVKKVIKESFEIINE